ncbi:mechanosensitive ion channel family protein [Devosia salina]|uniref:Mechanosensitive ion channel n=1 Tax=Devosia salina TaxID=2860336 RepID=A0ABX8WEB4_9HYPH|nr:mechanosensitive ion channel domain-containing protein [Devosia salina]QYO75969.1 mechanosensitive ion channel [Devosia salina]
MPQLDRAAATFFSWLPEWLISLVLFGLAIGLALYGGQMLHGFLTRLAAERDLFWRSLVKRLELPLKLGLAIVLCWIVAVVAPLTIAQSAWVRHALLIGIIVLGVMAARTAIHIWLTLYLRRFKLDSEDNLLARKHVTQSRILERVAVTLLVIIGIAAILMTFEGVAQYGVSLLASAGAAGLVLGLALQPVLKNLFAGIQLAITQPIRIDDALLVEGEWGTVEEITSTYVVVKIWDWRRLIVPLSYFMEKPFQNWTREGAALIGTVMLYLDYSVPVDVIRQQLGKIVEGSPNWDGNIAHVQVTDLREANLEVRILVTARNAPKAFDLRCEVREKMIAFLQENYPQTLPRVRTLPAETSPEDDQGARTAAVEAVDAGFDG